MFEKLKSFCDSFMDFNIPGFDLAIFKDGECILRHMNGYSDIENEIKINGTERYNMYSCSKPITCTAALQLWEKGLFSLEDKLSDYMPEFSDMSVKTENGIQKAKNPILIKHLFEMTAGFSYDTASPQLLKCKEDTNGKCPTREAMKYLAKEPLLFEPGTRWEYSLCHDVLAAFVEVVSGKKFDTYVKENIFDVLHMNNSTFLLPEEEIDSISQQYRFEDGKPVNVGKQIIPYKLGSEYVSGGAGLISTVDDYIKFLEGLRTNVLLDPNTLQIMTTNRLRADQRQNFFSGPNYGYGLGVRCYNDNDKCIDFGWGGAAGAYLAIDKENAISIYFGMHLLSSPVQGIRGMLYRFLRAELINESEFEDIENDLKALYDYNLTY